MGPSSPPLSWQTLSFSLPAGTPKGPRPVPNACSERLRGLMHGGLVGYVVSAAGCKVLTPWTGAKSFLRLSRGEASPVAS